MRYEITEQRKKYLDARGFTILTACPGSGKTTSIVYKLKTLIKECRINNANGSGILCLSFTNKACAEIISKYKEMHGTSIRYPNEIRTIDSFITQHIVFNYWYLIEGLSRPKIINEEELLRKLYFRYYKGNECIQNKFYEYKKIIYQYHPEKVEYLGNNLFKIENKIISKDNDILFKYCADVVRYRLTYGILKSSDAILIAIKILKNYPIVAKSLANRFPYIILDEAQDASEFQFYIIECLKNAGVKNIELVGDVNQAIYEWRNAKPEIFQRYTMKKEWNHLNLMENRRSVQRIIDFYSRLKPIGYPDIVSYGVVDNHIKIEIIRYNEGQEINALNRFKQICDDYELNSRLILVRGNEDLKKITKRKKGIKIWKNKIPYQIIEAKLLFDQNMIKEALDKMGWICANLICGENNFESMKNYVQEKEGTIEFNIMLLKLLKSVPSLSLSFNIWDEKIKQLLKETLKLTKNLDFAFKQKMSHQKIGNLRNESVGTYFGQVKENTVKVQTIHLAKGTSVDAVLLYLHAKSSVQGISFYDIPDKSGGLNKVKEKHRLIYVACSRARQLLAIAVPSSITEEQIRQKLNGLDIHISS